MIRVERTIVIEGEDEWVYRTLGSSLVGPDRPVYECPRGTITEIASEKKRVPLDTPDSLAELRELVGWMDDHLDADVAETYQGQPLAQDWARVAKVGEEAGEAIDALIGITGQNPRKGHYGQMSDLLAELADVALTGLYAMQHFTKNRHETVGLLMDRARYHRQRVENGSRERHADPSLNGRNEVQS